MNKNIIKNLAKRKKKINERTKRRNWDDQSKPMFSGSNIHYEFDGRNIGISGGGIGMIQTLAQKTGLIEEIDSKLELLKRHLPYHESDHVMNMVYNILSGGSCLEDIELLRNDEAFLNAVGAEIIPDPTTAGDFLRRFSEQDVIDLMEAKMRYALVFGISSLSGFGKQPLSMLTVRSQKPVANARKEWTYPTKGNGGMPPWLSL